MEKIFNFFIQIFTKKVLKKMGAYLLLIILLYFLRDFLGIFLLTFIFSYLFYSLAKFIKNKIHKFIEKRCRNKKSKNILYKIFNLNLIVILEYLFFIGIIVFVISDLLPKLIEEFRELPKEIPFVAEQLNSISSKLEEVKNINTEIGGNIKEIIDSNDFDIFKQIWFKIQSFGTMFFSFILSLIFSFVFIIDRKKLRKYLSQIKGSSFGFFYKEYSIIFEKIVKSFGLILKAQATIAFFNMIITIAGFYLIGLFYGGFPYIITMAIIVFLCSFIPILGMWLSALPLAIVAYISGGFEASTFVLLMVFFTTAFEVYFLNPKIVSSYFKLPISIIFIILMISEKFFGILGLLIGVSLFYFIIGLMMDFEKSLNKKNIKIITKKNKKND